MSLKTSKTMPIENYSVVQQSENGTQFAPMTKTRFRIPAHLGYVDFHTSYLEMDLEVQNSRGKMEFTNDMGADILIRSWRVLIGGHVVEEIDHPNVLMKCLKYDYGLDMGQEEVNQVLNKQGKYQAYQGLNKNDIVNISTTNPCKKVKITMDLAFSGVFGSTQTFPVGLTGDVEVEIVWEEARRCLQVVQSGWSPERIKIATGGANPTLVGWGHSIAGITGGGGALTNISLANAPADPVNYYTPNQSDTQGVNQAAAVGRCEDCPFSVGQGIRCFTQSNNVALDFNSASDITSIDNNAGATRLNGGAAFITDPTNNCTQGQVSFRSDGQVNVAGNLGGWDNNGTLTYEVSVPTLVLQVVAPPPQYVAEQSAKVNSEGLTIDIPTYTCYKSNTYTGVSSATLDIPCYSSRAKSILCIGVPEQSLGGSNVLFYPYQMRGDYNDLHQYQFQIGESREPVRPVVCENLSTYQHNVAQEQLTELEKALRSAGGDVNSLREYKNNFVIGRALSKYGGTISLAMKGARVYLDYLQNNVRNGGAVTVRNKNWFSYVHHIRRLVISGNGVQVMY